MVGKGIGRRTVLGGLGLGGLGAMGFLLPKFVGATSASTAVARVGELAPDFTLTDSNDRPVKLSALRGRLTVLEWSNPDCPYVRKHYDTSTMQDLQRQVIGEGAHWLTLHSMAPGKRGYVSGLEANAWLELQKAKPTHFLHDSKGHVAEAYGVQVVLHMVVIGVDGLIGYMGAIDDRPTSRKEDVVGARSYVREAVTAVAAGQPMKPAATRAYGCRAQ